MPEKTNNQLDTSIQLLIQQAAEIISTTIRIEAQTQKTNGRVSRLEVWRGFITGGLAVIVALLLPIVFIMISGYF